MSITLFSVIVEFARKVATTCQLHIFLLLWNLPANRRGGSRKDKKRPHVCIKKLACVASCGAAYNHAACHVVRAKKKSSLFNKKYRFIADVS